MISLTQLQQGPINGAPSSAPDTSNMSWQQAVAATSPKATPQQTATNTTTSDNRMTIGQVGSNYGSGLLNSWNQAVSKIPTDINQIATGLSSGKGQGLPGVGKGLVGGAEGTLNLLGDSVNAIFAPFSQAFSTYSDMLTQASQNDPEWQKVATNPTVSKILDFTNAIGSKVNTLAQSNPRAAQDIQSGINVVGGVVGDVAGGDTNINDIASGLKKGLADTSTAVTNAAGTAADAVNSATASLKTPETAVSPVATKIGVTDATPDYTPGAAENSPMKVTENTKIASGARSMVSTPQDIAAGNETVDNYPSNGSALQKAQAVIKQISTEGGSHDAALSAEDKANPIDPTAYKAEVSSMVMKNLPETIRAKIGVLSPEDKSMLAGMDKSAGLPEGTNSDVRLPGEKPGALPDLPKTPAGRYYGKVITAIDNFDGTRLGEERLRQAIDDAYTSEGGKYTHGSPDQANLHETHLDIRNDLNKDLISRTESTDVKAHLQRQTNLYHAADVLSKRAAGESETVGGRYLDKHPVTKAVVRTGTRVATRTAAYTAARNITKGVRDVLK